MDENVKQFIREKHTFMMNDLNKRTIVSLKLQNHGEEQLRP